MRIIAILLTVSTALQFCAATAYADSVNIMQVIKQIQPLAEQALRAQKQAEAEQRRQAAIAREKERKRNLAQTAEGRKKLKQEQEREEKINEAKAQFLNAIAGAVAKDILSGGGSTNCSGCTEQQIRNMNQERDERTLRGIKEQVGQ